MLWVFKVFVWAAIALASLSGEASPGKLEGGAVKSAYGSITKFSLNQEIDFSDFKLIYLGPSKEKGPAPFTIKFENFHIVAPSGEQQKIRWSSGLGDIGPTFFTVSTIKYSLELRMSDELKLKDDELIVKKLRGP